MLVGLDSCVDPVKVLYVQTHPKFTGVVFLLLGKEKNIANIKPSHAYNGQ